MSEILSIEAYLKFEPKKFEKTLERVKIVLMRLDLWNDETKNAFAELAIDGKENGYEYLLLDTMRFYPNKIADFPIKTAFTYISFERKQRRKGILALSRTLDGKRKAQNTGTSTYTAYDTIKKIASETFKEFSQTGVYLTDSNQHGMTFDGIEIQDAELVWNFDYALVPKHIDKLFSNIPADYNQKYLR